MTNDDLEKKIAEIIDSSVDDWATRDRRGRIQVHVSTIADILVKAGLKFDTVVSHTATFDTMQQDRINELEKRIAEAEHRAEVAERALRNAAPRLNCRGGLGKGFCKVDKCDYYHCNNDDGCVKAHLDQSEKELAEEGKDE